jgi:hypothetical protein
MLFKSLIDEFDSITSDVMNASNTNFPTNLDRWFEVLDEDQFAFQTIRDLTLNSDFDKWYADRKATVGSMVGSGNLTWPSGKRDRLAMQLALFHAFRDGKTDPPTFHNLFFGGTRHLDEMTRQVNDQIFGPMARDLRRFLIQQNEMKEQNSDTAPASDRTVTLDHNQPDYSAAMQSVDALEAAIREANDYDDFEDNDQRIAEISAGRRLLQASRVRVAALINTIGTALKWLIEKFAAGIIGQVAKRAWDALSALIGSGWPWPPF